MSEKRIEAFAVRVEVMMRGPEPYLQIQTYYFDTEADALIEIEQWDASFGMDRSVNWWKISDPIPLVEKRLLDEARRQADNFRRENYEEYVHGCRSGDYREEPESYEDWKKKNPFSWEKEPEAGE